MGRRKKDQPNAVGPPAKDSEPRATPWPPNSPNPGWDNALNNSAVEPKELLAEFGLSEEDIRRIKKLAPVFRKKKDEFVEKFYERILAMPQQSKFFESPEQLNRVKELQGRYFVRICEGQYDPAYIADRIQVGQTHNQIALPISYFLSAMNFYRSYVGELIEAEVKTKHEALATYAAFAKLVQFDAALVTHAYVQAREQDIRTQNQALMELSTPIIKIWENILMLPLVGTIDTQRAHQIVEMLLPAIVENESQVVIIDVRGVPVIDTRVAAHLIHTASASRLLGTQVLFSGISPHLAQTLTKIEVDLSALKTVGTMHNALMEALKITGHHLTSTEQAGE